MCGALLAGAAKEAFTPDEWLPMCGYQAIRLYEGGPRDHVGYIGRTGDALGCHDDLFVRALAVQSGATRFVLLSFDLCEITERLETSARKRLSAAYGLEDAEMLLAATHTHSSVDLLVCETTGRERVTERTAAAAEKAAGKALSSLTPVMTAFGVEKLRETAVNRRNADKPVDSDVTTLRFVTADDAVVATLLHYACHPNCLGSENRLYSADYPGHAAAVVEAACGGVCLFLNGAAGNVNPRVFPFKRDRNIDELERRATSRPLLFRRFPTARRLGALLAAKAILASDTAPVCAQGRLSVCTETVELPIKQGDALQTYFLHMDLCREERDFYAGRSTITVTVRGVRIADAVWVGIPGEPFNELGFAVEETAGRTHKKVIGYVGGEMNSYIPAADEYGENRYESVGTVLAQEAIAPLIAAAKRVAKKLEGDPS